MLVEWLARPNAAWDERSCLADPGHCAPWIVDLNRDGQADAVLIWERGGSTQAEVYMREAAGWRKQGSLQGRPLTLAQWTEAINSNAISLEPPKWPDIVVSGARFSVR